MVKNNSRLFIFLALLLSNNVFAEWYAGGQFSYAFIKADISGAEEFNPSALMLRGGYDSRCD